MIDQNFDSSIYLAKPPKPMINIFVQSRFRSVSRRSIKVTSVTLGGVGDTTSLIFIVVSPLCHFRGTTPSYILFILKKSQFLDWFAVLKLSFWFFGAREMRKIREERIRFWTVLFPQTPPCTPLRFRLIQNRMTHTLKQHVYAESRSKT